MEFSVMAYEEKVGYILIKTYIYNKRGQNYLKFNFNDSFVDFKVKDLKNLPKCYRLNNCNNTYRFNSKDINRIIREYKTITKQRNNNIKARLAADNFRAAIKTL